MKISEHIYLIGSGKLGFGITHPIDCNIYMVDTGDGLVVIDSGVGLDTDRIDKIIEEHGFSTKDVKAVFLTHYHGDHACGAPRFQKISGAKIYAPELEAEALIKGDEDAISLTGSKGGFYPMETKLEPADVTGLGEGAEVTIGSITFKVLMCPGHSLQDMVVYATIDGKPSLFTGDCVFAQGQVLIQSLYDVCIFPYAEAMRKIGQLEIEAIFPGHGVFMLENGHSYVDAALAKFNSGVIPPQLFYFA